MNPAPPVTQMDAMNRDLPVIGDPPVARVLGRSFYQRPTVDVARDLLGKVLVRETAEGLAAVRITEVEAYLGVDDPACHTFGGRRTPRVETMWGEAGFAYVYLVYGLYHCLNVVTVGPGVPEAVLIRGGVPLAGHDLVRERRGGRGAPERWLDGPGKLCQGLAVTVADDGADLCAAQSGLWIGDDGLRIPDEQVHRNSRVGVEYAGDAASWPLRFQTKGSPEP